MTKPNETPRSEKFAESICAYGIDWHHSAAKMLDFARTLERLLILVTYSAQHFLDVRTIDTCDPARKVNALPIANRTVEETQLASERLREALTLARKELEK